MPRRQRIAALTIAALLLCALPVSPAAATAPAQGASSADYGLPELFALPWACGESARITWRPESHWEAGKARGLAFDFSLTEGTPVYAPAAGLARFLRDDRPLASTLGNYVEIEVPGGWLIRLAHLQTEQQGEREVQAGELVALSGATGASAAHLHLELFAREGERWVTPDATRLPRLFGRADAELQEEAVIPNDGCAAAFAWAGEPSFAGSPDAGEPLDVAPLGAPVTLRLPVRNVGLEATSIRLASVTLQAPDGQARVVSAPGPWDVEGKGSVDLALPLHLEQPGEWRVAGASLLAEVSPLAEAGAGEAQGRVYALTAEAALTVTPGPVALVGLRTPERLAVGQQVAVEAWLQNTEAADVALEGFSVVGRTVRGEPWEAFPADDVLVVPGGALLRVDLQTREVPLTVGDWRVLGAAFTQEGRRYYLGVVAQSLYVEGPDLYARHVGLVPAPAGPEVLVAVANMGTAPAAPERLVLWLEDEARTHSLALDGAPLGRLLPGQTRLLRLPLGAERVAGATAFLGGAAWLEGRYVAVRALEDRPGGTSEAVTAPGEGG